MSMVGVALNSSATFTARVIAAIRSTLAVSARLLCGTFTARWRHNPDQHLCVIVLLTTLEREVSIVMVRVYSISTQLKDGNT